MADSAVWIVILAGGPAVLASWVTCGGSARAASIQAEACARAQQHGRLVRAR